MTPTMTERLQAIAGLLTCDFAVALYVICTIAYIVGRYMNKYT